MNDYKEIISKNIKRYRKAAGMSQVELAKELGITSASISNWEKGQNSIDTEMLFRLCSILNVSIDDMGSLEPPAASEQSSLSADELKLLNTYRSFNSTGKAKIMDYVADLESSPRNYGEVLDSCTGSIAKDDGESSGGCA